LIRRRKKGESIVKFKHEDDAELKDLRSRCRRWSMDNTEALKTAKPSMPDENMRRRGLASPDIADALALTFARPVFPRQFDNWMNGGSNVVSDYDPIQRFEDEMAGRAQTPPRYYAPGYPRLLKEYE
jgi:hypothetical protein